MAAFYGEWGARHVPTLDFRAFHNLYTAPGTRSIILFDGWRYFAASNEWVYEITRYFYTHNERPLYLKLETRLPQHAVFRCRRNATR